MYIHTQEGTRQQWMSHNREPEEEKTNAAYPAAGESLEVCVCICVCACVCMCVYVCVCVSLGSDTGTEASRYMFV